MKKVMFIINMLIIVSLLVIIYKVRLVVKNDYFMWGGVLFIMMYIFGIIIFYKENLIVPLIKHLSAILIILSIGWIILVSWMISINSGRQVFPEYLGSQRSSLIVGLVTGVYTGVLTGWIFYAITALENTKRDYLENFGKVMELIEDLSDKLEYITLIDKDININIEFEIKNVIRKLDNACQTLYKYRIQRFEILEISKKIFDLISDIKTDTNSLIAINASKDITKLKSLKDKISKLRGLYLFKYRKMIIGLSSGLQYSLEYNYGTDKRFEKILIHKERIKLVKIDKNNILQYAASTKEKETYGIRIMLSKSPNYIWINLFKEYFKSMPYNKKRYVSFKDGYLHQEVYKSDDVDTIKEHIKFLKNVVKETNKRYECDVNNRITQDKNSEVVIEEELEPIKQKLKNISI